MIFLMSSILVILHIAVLFDVLLSQKWPHSPPTPFSEFRDVCDCAHRAEIHALRDRAEHHRQREGERGDEHLQLRDVFHGSRIAATPHVIEAAAGTKLSHARSATPLPNGAD